MIDEIHIRNFALIEDCTMNFRDGFNILSGETGSGKSLIAASLAMLHGIKGDVKWIRTGCDECQVSGSFYVESREALSWLSSHDISTDDGSVLVTRTLKKNGRGSVHIQGVSVTREQLTEFVSSMFDIHGQHEQYTLINAINQQHLLDNYADLSDKLEKLRLYFQKLSETRRMMSDLEASRKESVRQAEMFEFAIREIDLAALKDGEEEELEKKLQILSQHDRLFKLLEEISALLGGTGAVELLRQCRPLMEQAGRIDSSLAEYTGRMDSAFFEIDDIASSVRDYLLRDNYDPQQLAQCEERLAVINRLKKKYGATISDILAYRDKASSQMDSINNFQFNMDKLQKDSDSYGKMVVSLSGEISAAREKAAAVLEKKIESVLKELGMPKSVFHIAVTSRTGDNGKILYSQSGRDNVIFMISPNAGEPLRPLSAAVSGGELSRIMLAVKSAFAGTDPVGTVLFDEIDTGIGGEIAVRIGRYMKELSMSKQVLCITHLASIAVNADNHIKVEKATDGERTFTRCHSLDDDGKVAEIARMLSGTGDSVSMDHARQMLMESRKFSANLQI